MFRSLLPTPRWSKIPARDEDVFGALQRDVNRLFEDFMHGLAPRRGGERGESPWSPDVDVKQANNEVVLSMDLPGVEDKDVEIVVRDDVITIKGERKSEKSEKGENYEVAERSYGRFERALQLPFHIDDKKVNAAYAKGVLTIRIPKPPEARLAETRIPISASATPAKAA
jgi:HSP20 family protein